ncbi:MAG TPA: histidine kinase [Chitinophagaceae bacterium]|nr:histidine kinase [Chitinophagaceae bacterium]
MKKIFNIKRFTFYLWMGLGYLVIGVLGNISMYPQTVHQRSLNDVWQVIYILTVNYFLFERTLPKLSRKHFWYSVALIFGYILLYSGGLCLWNSIGKLVHVFTAIPPPKGKSSGECSEAFGYSVGSVIFFAIVRHIFNHRQLKQAAQQLKIEKQQAELNYLKSQTNPHFLFNTLNNIYSLARDKSDLAPDSILRLSKILRYMLYEAGGEYIAIEQELKIITDYIGLEKLRYDELLRINFNYDVEDMKQALPPLLLIPLVENAFKHGASETRGRPYVDIHLSVKNRQLALYVKNSAGEPAGEGKVKENIGLSNLRRQLELLYTDYNLSVQQQQYEFVATLKINLASHV